MRLIVALLLFSTQAFGSYYVYHEEKIDVAASTNGFCRATTPRVFYALRDKNVAWKYAGGHLRPYGGTKGTHGYIDHSEGPLPSCSSAPIIWEIDDSVPHSLWARYPDISITPEAGLQTMKDIFHPEGLNVEPQKNNFIQTKRKLHDSAKHAKRLCKRTKRKCRDYIAGDENE